MAGCGFCERLAAGERPLVDGERAVALTETAPHAVGHTVVVPRQHVGRLLELDTETYRSLFTVAHLALERLEEEHRPDAFTLGMNDGPAAGQSTPHVHLHLVPRNAGDVPEPRGGVRNALPPRLDT